MRIKILPLTAAVDCRIQVQRENSEDNATDRDQLEFIRNDGENVSSFLRCRGVKHKAGWMSVYNEQSLLSPLSCQSNPLRRDAMRLQYCVSRSHLSASLGREPGLPS